MGLLPLPQGQPTSVPGWPAHLPEAGWTVLVTATERQDALWFLRIATQGYHSGDGSAAFFPLYPLVVNIVAWLPGLGPLGAALLVANVCFFGALLMLHALTRLELGAEAARRAVLFAALFPTAFFFMAPYTEAPFLLLSIAAFWFARRDRWGWAALAGAGAALTRSIGVLLVFGLAVEAFRQHRKDGRPLAVRLAASLAVAAGPLLYAFWWLARFDDFWAPLQAQRNWARTTTWPSTTIGHALTDAWRWRTYWLIDLLVVAIVVWGVVRASRRIPAGYTVYAGLSLLLPLLFPFEQRPLMSMPRFVAVVFPAFWGFAIATERRRPPENMLVAGFAAGYGLLAVLFVSWHYIF
ncbi:MAG: hypothetical protein IMZ75_03665 [Actinobacteria bacterium]|nr:hypothetical protein [Actinomycetota bacterium]